MVQVSYPGVYIQEIPSSVHTITSVSTSITAFIDFFKEGPTNKAVEVFGMTDFERVFGGLDDRSEASYALAQFFLNREGVPRSSCASPAKMALIHSRRLEPESKAGRAAAIPKS
jgi:phage tail sheath protein FI